MTLDYEARKLRRVYALMLLVALPLLTGCRQGDGNTPTEEAQTTSAFTYDQAALPKAKPWTSEDFQNNPESFQFAIIGDRTGGANAQGTFDMAMDQINLLQPEFVINVGDVIEGYSDEEAELNAEWDEVDGMLKKLDMPFFRTPGNHDIANETAQKVWRERYGASNYYFVYQEVLFLVLDSEDPPRAAPEGIKEKLEEYNRLQTEDPAKAQAMLAEFMSDEAVVAGLSKPVEFGEKQIAFVKDTLAKHADARWTFLFLHEPAWENPSEGFKAIQQLLKVRDHTFFAGHLHYYDYDEIDGHEHITMGPAGASWHHDGPGNVDHMTWVTMTENEPQIGNIALKGLFDRKGLDPELFGAYDRKGSEKGDSQEEEKEAPHGKEPSPLVNEDGAGKPPQAETTELSDADVEDLVRRSYQYVAMYNVNNKFADVMGGWNRMDADTELKDHTMREIARPNNDTLYIGCQLDLRKDPVILEMPAFSSKYVSLMVCGYDHYVNIPMSTRLGDFEKPAKMLFYTVRTEGYDAEPVEGVDRLFKATGDFINATLRIMPHSNDSQQFERIVEQMKSVKIQTLSEFRGGKAKPIDDIEFPPVGNTDADVFSNNLLEVMQFVINHTTFDPRNEMDQGVLAAYKPLGVEPGKVYDPAGVVEIDGQRFRETAERIQRKWLASLTDQQKQTEIRPRVFQPKNQTDLEATLAVSIIGPIGVPQEEAVYPQVATADGRQMNAMHDYVIRMTKDELPPAGAFWSLTLYDLDQGFFIPNDRKKYSVGENGGMKLNEAGGIEIYIAAEKPDGVPEENWLPIERKDLNLSPQMRLYVPDLEKMKTWTAPKAEVIK